MKNTKKLLTLLSLSTLLLMTSCDDNRVSNSDSSINESTDKQEEIRVDNGTEAAKLLLAQERLDSSVIKDSNGLFAKGKKAFSKIVSETRKYSKNYAKKENETYTEIEGDVVRWYNDVDYSNFNSFFESYAVNIEITAQRGSDLIDNTKKNIRVVDKWVNANGTKYLLKVDENKETIYSKTTDFTEICRRSTDALGHDVYEMLLAGNDATTRMKYIPGLVYEFSITSGEFTHYLFAENYKGYWTVNSTSGIREGRPGDESISLETMILKDEACYQFSTITSLEGLIEPGSLTIISNDHKTDLLVMGKDSFQLFNTGIEGLDHLKIEATEEQRNEFFNDFEKDKNTIVYEQSNVNEKGEKYTIYSTSGHKSATAVLENGLEFTEGDTFLNGQLQVRRIDVSYVAGCDSYGRIPFITTATTLEENFELIKQFLNENGITFRRDLDEVMAATEFALNDVTNYTKYYKWNGYSINDYEEVKAALKAEDAKTEALVNEYNSYKDVEVIDFEDQEAMNKNIYFSDITLEKDMVVANEGFKVNLTEASVKVSDTLLFVDKQEYSLVLALQNKQGSIFPIQLSENTPITSTAFTKGQEFKTTQSLSVEIPLLDEGEYVLVAYVATKEEGIRVTNPIAVKGTFTEASHIATGITQNLTTNEDGNLIITSIKTHDIYATVEETLTYEKLSQLMSETAYQYGTIDEVVIEKLIDDTWTVVEAPVEEEVETVEEVTEESLQDGQYRMKYIVNNESQEEVGYVYITLITEK